LFFFGYDDNGCPSGSNRHGGLPTANLKWAKRQDALTRFMTHGVPVPNTTAGRRKLQNRLIALKKRHVAEGEGFLHRLRIMRASHRASVCDVEVGIYDDDDFAAVGAPPNEDADGHSSDSTGLLSMSTSSLSGSKADSTQRPALPRGTVNTLEPAVAPDLAAVALTVANDDGDDNESDASDITSLLSKSSLSEQNSIGTSSEPRPPLAERKTLPLSTVPDTSEPAVAQEQPPTAVVSREQTQQSFGPAMEWANWLAAFGSVLFVCGDLVPTDVLFFTT
jgi:hypothetical protein